jgi:hypothetical protein
MKKIRTTSNQFLTHKQKARLLILCFTVMFAFVSFAITDSIGTISENGFMTAKAAQKQTKGAWSSELKEGKLQISFTRNTSKKGFNNSSAYFSIGELQGLLPEAISSTKTTVKFNIMREAGTFVCKGYFSEGRGTGFWTFTANQNFVSTMRGRGYRNLTEDDLYYAALYNINSKLIEDLKVAGYNRLSFENLLEAGMFNVTPEFIQLWRSAGFKNLSLSV